MLDQFMSYRDSQKNKNNDFDQSLENLTRNVTHQYGPITLKRHFEHYSFKQNRSDSSNSRAM